MNKLVNSKELQNSFEDKDTQQYKDFYNALNNFTDGKYFMTQLGMAMKKKIMKKKFELASDFFMTATANTENSLVSSRGRNQNRDTTPAGASSPISFRKPTPVLEKKETYNDLNQKLKYPSNPAYFNQKKISRTD